MTEVTIPILSWTIIIFISTQNIVCKMFILRHTGIIYNLHYSYFDRLAVILWGTVNMWRFSSLNTMIDHASVHHQIWNATTHEELCKMPTVHTVWRWICLCWGFVECFWFMSSSSFRHVCLNKSLDADANCIQLQQESVMAVWRGQLIVCHLIVT